ncbi:MAG: PQQ-binding-like beta-propeller repeat protein [Pirellulaceae bacterium]|nr:PQQ-binding-like beta-propeller repeat protein [Pirellulaceae bacterium]
MMMRNPSIVIFGLFVSSLSAAEGEWTRFRGPNGTGLSDATRIPITWTEQDYNWIVDLPGVGHSSPVVWDRKLIVTCGDPKTATRIIVCLDGSDGHTIWQRDYRSENHRQHRHNSYATATPSVDAHGAITTWTTPDEVVLLALDLDGNEQWRRDLGPFVGPHGSGSSPIIAGDLVVLANEQEDPAIVARMMGRKVPTDPPGKSFLIAVDRKTGQTRWQVPRRTALAAYSTPCVRRTTDGAEELIFTSTAYGITAIDLATGRVNWEIDGVFEDRCVGSPVLAGELVIGSYGHGVRGMRCIAVRPGSRSTDTKPAIIIDVTRSVPLVPSPLVKGNRIFLWADDGVVTCLDGSSGEVIWRERVDGSYYGSPVCVRDRLYCISRDGEVVVVSASDRFEVLARIPLGEPSFATPAISNGVMYLRTQSHLYSLGEP